MRAGPYPELRYHLSGRLIARRKSGEIVLLDLRDRSGTIRLTVNADADSATATIVDADIGDIVSVVGHIYVTPRDKLCLEVESGSLLAKALQLPLTKGLNPNGRRRELELMASAECRRLFTARATALMAIRDWMTRHDFLEVETPILQRLAGGALARPFVTHHNALDCQVSLRLSTELYLRRCSIGDMERVYELGKCFRNEGISRRHSPEFTMLEWYVAYCDYRDVAASAEQLVQQVASRVLDSLQVTYKGNVINLEGPWRRMTLREAIKERTGLDIFAASRAELSGALPGSPTSSVSWADAVQKIYGSYVEPHLIQPTIIYDCPVDMHPCVKRHAGRSQLVESFEVVLGGLEISSGGTALTDPDEQWQRFEAQRSGLDGTDPHPNDQELVAALQYGAPPAAGGGMGIDRLLMILLDCDSIRDVTLFPIA
jgi:lysyl-tRNA synthetase class 2